MAAAVEEIRASSYVGFDTITRQIEHKLLKRGFQFNIIVVGQTGIGKSTLINTIFASHLIDSKGRLEHDEPIRQTTEIQAVSHGEFYITPRFDCHYTFLVVIVENGVKLRLNIVDTPGYGDQINNEAWHVDYATFLLFACSLACLRSWDPIVKYIKVRRTRAEGCSSVSPLYYARTNILLISARSLLLSVTATSRTHASIAVSSSSTPPVTHYVPLT